MYVRACACVARVYERAWMRGRVRAYVRAFACLIVSAFSFLFIYVRVRVRVRMRVRVRVRVRVHVRVRVLVLVRASTQQLEIHNYLLGDSACYTDSNPCSTGLHGVVSCQTLNSWYDTNTRSPPAPPRIRISPRLSYRHAQCGSRQVSHNIVVLSRRLIGHTHESCKSTTFSL